MRVMSPGRVNLSFPERSEPFFIDMEDLPQLAELITLYWEQDARRETYVVVAVRHKVFMTEKGSRISDIPDVILENVEDVETRKSEE